MSGATAVGAGTPRPADHDVPVPGRHRCPEVVAGIDIGGTSTSAVLLDVSGQVLARARRRTPAQEGGAAMSRVALEVVRDALSTSGATLRAVGVGAAGVVDPMTGAILAASDSFRDWVGHPLAEELSSGLGVPVRVENDVNAFLRGELVHGAARGSEDVLGITLGTGVGGALVLGGVLHRGPRGGAGEIGHVPGFGDLPCTCGRRGHLETLASGRSIARRYAERTGGGLGGSVGAQHSRTRSTTPTVAPGGPDVADGPGTAGGPGTPGGPAAAEVAERARRGDADALAVLAEAGEAVGRAAVMVATLVDVVDVVVGGGVATSWDLLGPAVRAGIDAQPPVSGAHVQVRPAALGPDAVAVGAAVLAADAVGVR